MAGDYVAKFLQEHDHYKKGEDQTEVAVEHAASAVIRVMGRVVAGETDVVTLASFVQLALGNLAHESYGRGYKVGKGIGK